MSALRCQLIPHDNSLRFHTANSHSYAVVDDAGGGVWQVLEIESRKRSEAAGGKNYGKEGWWLIAGALETERLQGSDYVRDGDETGSGTERNQGRLRLMVPSR